MLSLAIPKAISYDDEIIMEAGSTPAAKKFSVNFVIDDNNIPLHVRTEFGASSNDDRIILNHKIGGTWQKEFTEKLSWTRPGQQFLISFLINNNSIIIYENDSFMSSFAHKMDITQVRTVQLWDDFAKLDSVAFKYTKRSKAKRSTDCATAKA
ncbi:galectin-1-like [Lutzomyia longipalpis]|uniref:Galectin n=1 Tax=Lutzomyia longipalpis TaxID=7200 RepID=A0A1B0CX13_LUTLO|nr:galectin-1-like [Lutzomyia longipalpis]